MHLALLQDSLATSRPATGPAVPPGRAAVTSVLDALRDALGPLGHGGSATLGVGLLALAAVALVWDRARALRRTGSDAGRLVRGVADHVRRGDQAAAAAHCRAQGSPAGRVLLRGVERLGQPLDEIKDALDGAARREAAGLHERMDALALVAWLGPAVGSLGAVVGAVGARRVAVGALDGPLTQALVSAGAGLAVGALALVAYVWLRSRVREAEAGFRAVTAGFVDVLQAPAPIPPPATRALEPTPV